jgi:hypothetical protein
MNENGWESILLGSSSSDWVVIHVEHPAAQEEQMVLDKAGP